MTSARQISSSPRDIKMERAREGACSPVFGLASRQYQLDISQRNKDVCDLLNSFMWVQLTSMKTPHTFQSSGGIAGVHPSSSQSYYFVSSQVDNLFYLDYRHTGATIPLRLPTHTLEMNPRIQIKQATPERVSLTSRPPLFAKVTSV